MLRGFRKTTRDLHGKTDGVIGKRRARRRPVAAGFARRAWAEARKLSKSPVGNGENRLAQVRTSRHKGKLGIDKASKRSSDKKAIDMAEDSPWSAGVAKIPASRGEANHSRHKACPLLVDRSAGKQVVTDVEGFASTPKAESPSCFRHAVARPEPEKISRTRGSCHLKLTKQARTGWKRS